MPQKINARRAPSEPKIDSSPARNVSSLKWSWRFHLLEHWEPYPLATLGRGGGSPPPSPTLPTCSLLPSLGCWGRGQARGWGDCDPEPPGGKESWGFDHTQEDTPPGPQRPEDPRQRGEPHPRQAQLPVPRWDKRLLQAKLVPKQVCNAMEQDTVHHH